MVEQLITATLRMATPILLAALGGLICERLGIFNIALEGMMLFGAFFAIFGVYLSMSPIVGLLFAMIVSGLVGWLFITLVNKLGSDPTITALGINTLALGVTTYLMKMVFGNAGSVGSDRIVGLPRVEIPFLENIPGLRLISGFTPLVYVVFIFVIILSFFLYRTYIGINLRAIGEKPIAAATAGISVNRYRVLGFIAAGALCGLAGAHLSLGYVTLFSEGMTAGRGFFAYSAVVFGKADPLKVTIASLIFGFAEAFAINVQSLNVPSSLILSIPYVITVVALVLRSGSVGLNSFRKAGSLRVGSSAKNSNG